MIYRLENGYEAESTWTPEQLAQACNRSKSWRDCWLNEPEYAYLASRCPCRGGVKCKCKDVTAGLWRLRLIS